MMTRKPTDNAASSEEFEEWLNSDDPNDHEKALAIEMADLSDDPLEWVYYAYPWGTGELEGFYGPDEWQRGWLTEWGQEIRLRKFDGITPVAPIRMTTTSGHGVGKSALTSWATGFIMSTRPGSKGIITANTSPQLETKTWAEIAKWSKRMITAHWFRVTTGRGAMKMVHRADPENWRVDGMAWRENMPEAFAGLHAATGTPFYIFDEACHDDATEVMTLAGWKFFKHVNKDDMLLTPDGWQHPTALHVSHRRGVMKLIKKRGLSMMVTPNHDLWLKSPSTGLMRKKQAQDVKSCGEMSPRTVEWSNEEYPVSDDELKLYAWYFSEGSLAYNDTQKYGRRYTGFAITNNTDHGITELLNRIGVKWGKSGNQWIVYDKERAEYFAKCGHGCLVKTFPDWMFSLSQRQMKVFLDIYAIGDGYIKGGGRIIYTSSERMANDLHALSCLAGFNSSLTKRSIKGQRKWIKDHWATSSTDGYVVTLSETGAGVKISSSIMRDVDYDGMVYCATVPSGLLLTRRNGTVIWSGNSGIARIIFETAEGGLTDGEPMQFLFSNPTQGEGFFYDTHHEMAHRYHTFKVDSRKAMMTNKKQIQEWIEDYGIDSNFVKVRVLGEFPSASNRQFIPTDIVTAARSADRVPFFVANDPVIIGVDVARYGGDESTIYVRRGRDARTEPPIILRDIDNVQLAHHIRKLNDRLMADAINIDAGQGQGVIDTLRNWGVPNINEIHFGIPSPDDEYDNMATYMMAEGRDWLRNEHSTIPDDPILASQMTARRYWMVEGKKGTAVKIESKEEIYRNKEKNEPHSAHKSPDRADGFFLTFAVPVKIRDIEKTRAEMSGERPSNVIGVDYERT